MGGWLVADIQVEFEGRQLSCSFHHTHIAVGSRRDVIPPHLSFFIFSCKKLPELD